MLQGPEHQRICVWPTQPFPKHVQTALIPLLHLRDFFLPTPGCYVTEFTAIVSSNQSTELDPSGEQTAKDSAISFACYTESPRQRMHSGYGYR